MKLNFITSQSLKNISGGWSGNSFNIYNGLKKTIDTEYIGPINPKIPLHIKTLSKFIRIIGLKSNFYYFSNKRLSQISRIIQSKVKDSDYNFFMGPTPWIKYESTIPYGAYLDACFTTYLNNNINISKFSKKDILRIELLEKKWLENALHIFWTSEWARDEAIKHYKLTSKNHFVIRIGGNIPVPQETEINRGKNFLFIAQNFKLKGGDFLFCAFKNIFKEYSNITLTILGQKPPKHVLEHPGIIYPGYLEKSIPEQNKQFLKILEEAYCLVHPTRSDATPQVIIECGYYGCPSIAPSKFAIPELIKHKHNGYLMPENFSISDIEKGMRYLLENENEYYVMRTKTRNFFINRYTSSNVVSQIKNYIQNK